jgi:hypothetical protein
VVQPVLCMTCMTYYINKTLTIVNASDLTLITTQHTVLHTILKSSSSLPMYVHVIQHLATVLGKPRP